MNRQNNAWKGGGGGGGDCVGPDKKCWHFFEHYRYLEALSNI